MCFFGGSSREGLGEAKSGECQAWLKALQLAPGGDSFQQKAEGSWALLLPEHDIARFS